MNIEIITKNFQLDIYGFGSIALNKDYAGTAFKLSGKMWDVIKANSIKNKGKNIWVYEPADKVFAGVELDDPSGSNDALEHLKIDVVKYAYYKHIGSYSLIKQVGQTMRNEVAKQGYETTLPYLEVYGHWTRDETKLETEFIMSLK